MPGQLVRVRMIVAYHGGGFHGFVAQPGMETVAGLLGAALAKVLRLAEAPSITCAGRTDSGVHAWGQTVHFDVPVPAGGAPDAGAPEGGSPEGGAPEGGAVDGRVPDGGPPDAALDVVDLQRRLVKLLAPRIVVREVSTVSADWDARRSARSRTYRYTVLNRPLPNPFLHGRVWLVQPPLDRRVLVLACDPLIGEHDFSSFCRKLPPPRIREAPGEGAEPFHQATLVRRVIDARWVEAGEGLLRFDITATAFCQQMVRSVVGILVDIGLGRRRAGEMAGILRARDRAAAGTVAPPDGLCLWEVEYPPLT